MKKMSDRGIATLLLVVAIVLGAFTVATINRWQNVSAKKWQEEIGLRVELPNGL